MPSDGAQHHILRAVYLEGGGHLYQHSALECVGTPAGPELMS
jgi:hypothetical protein